MGGGSSTRHKVGFRPVVFGTLGCVSAAGLALYAVLLSRQRLVDFEVYRMGGQHVLGSGLYSSHVTVSTGNLLFTYTPLAAMLFWPFSHLPTGVGQVIWDITNVVALTALIAVSSAAAHRRPLMRSDWRLGSHRARPDGPSPMAGSLRSQTRSDRHRVGPDDRHRFDDRHLLAGKAAPAGRTSGSGRRHQADAAHLCSLLARHAPMARREEHRSHVHGCHRYDDGACAEIVVELLHEVRI